MNEIIFNSAKDVAVKVKKLADDAQMPTRGSAAAAGWDLYAHIPSGFVWIKPGETVLIDTGLSIAINDGWFGGIYARSGLAVKKGLVPINEPGVIDADYRGPVKVALYNHSDMTQRVDTGDRIAQMIFHKVPTAYWSEVDELDDTVRASGGFGSTGEK